MPKTFFSNAITDRTTTAAARSGGRKLLTGAGACALALALATPFVFGPGCNSGSPGGTEPPPGDGTDMAGQPPPPPPGFFRVTVMKSGEGTGTVTSQPAGIDCGSTCAANLPEKTTVTLTAQGASGSVFSGWQGDCAGQGGVCTLSLTKDVSATATFATRFCTVDNFCWEAPLPFGFDLTSVFAVAADDVWAVGKGGVIMRYNGQRWSRVMSPTNNDLLWVYARAKDDVWIAAGLSGGVGLLLRWNGTTFTQVPTTGSNVAATAVWGQGNTLIVATKSVNMLVSTNNGTSFAVQSSGGRAGLAEMLSVFGKTTNDVWALGIDVTTSRYNGTSWTLPYGRNVPIVSMSGVYPNAVNDTYLLDPAGNFYRYTGGATYTKIGNVPAAYQDALHLWGPALNQLFSVGSIGKLFSYNGTQWTAIDTGETDIGRHEGLHGTTASDVWAVGPRGSIVHYDGSKVGRMRSNVFSTGDFVAAGGSSASDAWFVIQSGSAVHFDGAGLSESKNIFSGLFPQLNSISVAGPKDVWVGGEINSNPAIAHYDGSSWFTQTLPPIYAGSGASVDQIWVAKSGKAGFAGGAPVYNLLRWDGAAWTVDFGFSLTNNITALWGSSDADAWVSEGAKTYHWDGGRWTQDTRVMGNVYCLTGSSGADVWAGSDGAVNRYNGSTWTRMMIPAATGVSGYIRSIAAISPTEAYLADSKGVVVKWDGTAFKRVDIGYGSTVYSNMALYAADSNSVWIAGRGLLSNRK